MPSAAQIDFTHRTDPATLPELMDQPCAYEQFRDCLRDLASVNRWTLAYQPTLRFLERALAAHPPRQPLRILDVGSGAGDALRQIALWAARRKLHVQLTGIDLNPYSTRAAREFSAHNPRFADIQWLTADIYAAPLPAEFDLILNSLMTHHLRDDEIVRFLCWLEANARLGWFINDVLRSPRAFRLFGILAKLMRWHPFVQHDGPVSIRRGFRREDWVRLLTAAQVPPSAVHIDQPIPGRLCVTRIR